MTELQRLGRREICILQCRQHNLRRSRNAIKGRIDLFGAPGLNPVRAAVAATLALSTECLAPNGMQAIKRYQRTAVSPSCQPSSPSRIDVNEIAQQRMDLVIPAPAAEYAVMADAGPACGGPGDWRARWCKAPAPPGSGRSSRCRPSRLRPSSGPSVESMPDSRGDRGEEGSVRHVRILSPVPPGSARPVFVKTGRSAEHASLRSANCDVDAYHRPKRPLDDFGQWSFQRLGQGSRNLLGG